MSNYTEVIEFYKRPDATAVRLIKNEDLKWIFPSSIYLVSYILTILFMACHRLIYNSEEFLSTIYFVPLLTVPFIFTHSFTGITLFRVFNMNLQTHLFLSILLISYVFLTIPLMITLVIGFSYLGQELSPMLVVLIYLLTIVVSKLVLNFKIFKTKTKRIWMKSFFEIIITFILSILIIGGVTQIINTP